LLVAGVAAAAWAWLPDLLPIQPLRIAVLPFIPDTDDAQTVALAQRVTDGVTAELVRAKRFGVVASSAARAEYAVTRRPREVAAALDADALVEARISLVGPRVHVEARAARGNTEEKLWVQSFAGDAADTEALEREIAAAISAAFSYAKVVRETQ
jgi:TolB-like protein